MIQKPARNFVPTPFPSDDAIAVASLYDTLEGREIPTSDAGALRLWILDWSEFESVLREESARRYIAMTCDTRDPKAAEAFEHFTTQIEPVASEKSDRLKRKLMQHPARALLEPEFGIWFRDVQVALDLFRPENIPLETSIALEVQAYQKITGSHSVIFQGEERTLSQMAPFQQSPDRKIREEAWRLVASRRFADREALNEAFGKLFKLRLQVADNSGFAGDFLSYIFKAKGRFDYSPKDCRSFHQSIRTLVVPRIKKILARRAQQMGLASLRPWDVDCDPLGRNPLKPFLTGDELLGKVQSIFNELHPRFGEWFGHMRTEGLIDTESRMGKAPGGYQISLDESRVPFIFTNASGTNGDVYTMLHEAGHSFHQFAMAHQPIVAFRDTPAEFAEVASMSMELIASSDLSPFYPTAEAARSRQEQFEDVILLLPWVAMVDAFQHELYTRPGHTAKDRQELWMQLQLEFDTGIDWSGLEELRAYSWQRQLHIFEVPFYYIEYGIAQLGALQLWANYRKNPTQALEHMIEALSLGASSPLPELFSRAGIRFNFTEATLEPLMSMVEEELARLEKA
jgi:oligoendopeptidase F